MTDGKAYNKAYYLTHKKEMDARSKAYHLAHAEEMKVKMKAYNLARAKETKAYRLAHKNKLAAQQKAYRLAHKKEITEYRQAYCRKYPGKKRDSERKRNALKRGNIHEPYTDTYIFERDGWICQICGRKIDKRLKCPIPLSPSIDHIVPISKGGSDSPINVQAAHLKCNMIKKAQSGGQLRLIG